MFDGHKNCNELKEQNNKQTEYKMCERFYERENECE